MLSHEDYQKIVNRLMNILGKNINIMDTKGVIIASGDSTRIGFFHEGAKIAASRKMDVIIDDSNIEYYKGAKKGINVPLFYNGEVIGVVGITGEPKEIIGFGRIIKELVELMVQEYENKKYEELHSKAMVSFIKEILNHPNIGHEEEKILESRAKLIGFDTKKQRSLIVADIRGFNDFILSKNLKEIDIQELKENIVEFIKSKLNDDEIVFNFNEDRFVIILYSKNPMPFCKELQEGIKKRFNLSSIIGIGPDCKNMKDYHTSFTIANNLIDIGRKIDKDILGFKDYKIELLIHSLSINDSIVFFEEYKDILNSKNKDIINTIKVYFESGMNISLASKKLFIHRNTLTYRLNKIKEKFNVDITNPYVCMKVYISILVNQLSH
ncbi:CdaR family transcriptional regulator [Thermoanaerobacter pentosaceus]|uniref:Carbohydrate diacid regulator n=1 Tax=Thermoanaerobacter pentosaceus TaxID=694059 RepID=A0ABT9M3N4_9THEO|nr:sugar diacid recognition domain-containing protein [Thermoanaerobacter pentosaceus]MDP9750735.1 carbohydrate diacid regulator [Thermoanaerobacter pentosaceus]